MYAQDEMGGGHPLASDVRATLLDALRAHPGDVWLEMLRDLCEAVEAEDRGKIVLLTGPFVRTANPRMRPIEDLPESLL